MSTAAPWFLIRNHAANREAASLGKHRTKREAVTQALTDYVRHLRQERILDLFGDVEFDEEYDPKRQRARE